MENYSDFVVHKSERAVHTDSIILTVDDGRCVQHRLAGQLH